MAKLICVTKECPSCGKDITLDIGSHDGMGGNMDMIQYKECHRCGNKFKLDANGIIPFFLSVEEYSDRVIKEHLELS